MKTVDINLTNKKNSWKRLEKNQEEYNYKQISTQEGYLRLNPFVKKPYALEVYKTAKRLGLKVCFSDPDFKEFNDSVCCCGLQEETFPRFGKYCRGQFSTAIQIAKDRGMVAWGDIEPHLQWMKHTNLASSGINMIGKHDMDKWTIYTYVRNAWNNPNSAHSPYRLFNGKMKPVSVDQNKNVVYKYVPSTYEEEFK